MGSLRTAEGGLVRQALHYPQKGPPKKALLHLLSQALGLGSPAAESSGSYGPQAFVKDMEVSSKAGNGGSVAGKGRKEICTPVFASSNSRKKRCSKRGSPCLCTYLRTAGAELQAGP